MAQVIIRNLDARVVERLKRMAERDKTSLEQKLREVLTRAAGRDDEAFERLSAKVRAATAGAELDLDDILREGRERCPTL